MYTSRSKNDYLSIHYYSSLYTCKHFICTYMTAGEGGVIIIPSRVLLVAEKRIGEHSLVNSQVVHHLLVHISTSWGYLHSLYTQWNTIDTMYTGLYHTHTYQTIQSDAILYYTIQYNTIQYYTILYYTIQYYTIMSLLQWIRDSTVRIFCTWGRHIWEWARGRRPENGWQRRCSLMVLVQGM